MAGGTIQQLLNGAVIRQRGQVRSVLVTDWSRCRQMNLSWQKGKQKCRQTDVYFLIRISSSCLAPIKSSSHLFSE
jgi:hypothetical protein